MILPEDIELWYCQACYQLLRDSDLPREEPTSCPYCHVDPLAPIRHAEWARKRAEMRRAFDRAVADGLIQPRGRP
jgi:hypothetical protein